MTSMIHPKLDERIQNARLEAMYAEEQGFCFGGVVISLTRDEAKAYGPLPKLTDVSFFITPPQEGVSHDNQ